MQIERNTNGLNFSSQRMLFAHTAAAADEIVEVVKNSKDKSWDPWKGPIPVIIDGTVVSIAVRALPPTQEVDSSQSVEALLVAGMAWPERYRIGGAASMANKTVLSLEQVRRDSQFRLVNSS